MMQPELQTILYVEDDADIAQVAEIALVNLGGFRLCSCLSGREAIHKAEGTKADLLLLDVMMPGMDGRATLTELRKLDVCAKTPVIFMTAKLQEEDLVQYRELGAIGVLAKPFDAMKLAQKVRELWQEYHQKSGAMEC